MRNMRNKGFTLIELIVVIAILGVLAAVLVPSISNYVNRANLSVASKNGSAVLSAAQRINTKIGTGELSSLDAATIYAECGIEVTLGASAPTTDGVVMEVVDNQVQTIWSRKGDQLATWTKADGWDFTVSSGGGSGGSSGGTPQTITFSTNGGSSVVEITASSGEEISSPTPPTRSGYTFGGWYRDEALTTEFTFSTMPSSSITVFAKWNINQSTINFNSNGGSAVSAITQDVFSAVTAPAAPTKSGFDFEGWYSDVGLTSAYTFSVMPVSSITLYAKWEVQTSAGLSYNVVDGGYEISKGDCIDGNIIIPSSYNGQPIVKIADNAFANDSTITSITIPSSITTIGNNAFANCSSLISLIIPDNIVTVGTGILAGCNSLTTLQAPFKDSGEPSSVRYYFGIANNDYQSKPPSSLKTFNIASGTTAVPDYAFAFCVDITNVSIPGTVTSIGSNSFNSCGIASITIPTSVTSLGNWAFGQSNLTSITIPSSVASIGAYAFYSCSFLKTVTVSRSTPPTLGLYSFNYTHSQLSIKVPSGRASTYKNHTDWKPYSSKIS